MDDKKTGSSFDESVVIDGLTPNKMVQGGTNLDREAKRKASTNVDAGEKPEKSEDEKE